MSQTTTQIIDASHDIGPALEELLARLFPGQSCQVAFRSGRFIVSAPRFLSQEEIISCSWNPEDPLRLRRSDAGRSESVHWLREELETARIECLFRAHSFFVPKDVQENLITESTVAEDIQAHNPNIKDEEVEGYAKKVCQCARSLYATLAYIRRVADICALLNEGITDNNLPLMRKPNDRTVALCLRGGKPVTAMANWRTEYWENFDRIQWWMTAPVFEYGGHYSLDEKTILPYVYPSDEDIGEKRGGYSKVYPVCIHPAHHDFWISKGRVGPSFETEPPEPLVAVKQPFSSEETEFRKESTILRALGPKNHPHLIKSLATYKIGKKYHLIFPYANANLRKYWEDHPAPSFTRDTVLWSLQQMSGIVKGLQLIHDFRVNIPLSVPSASTIDSRLGEGKGLGYLKVQKGEQWFGRHGDIKPENILWFAKDQYSPFRYPMGVLQIADFGMGRFHGRDSHSGVDPEISAPAYEPPECKMHIPVSRAYDIWSLGCLYLEFITWVLRGSPAIDAFADFRGRNTDTGINDDSFFTIANEDGVLKANVREGVLAWSEQLHADKNCSKLIHDLLDLTMSELLVIETEKRSKANWLCIRFQKLLHRAESDPEYLLKPDPRRLNQLALGRDITHSDSGGERVVEKTRATKAKNDREIELNDMKKFADSFKLTTPLPSVPTSWHHEVPAGLERIAEDEGQEGCSTDDRSHNTGAVRKEPSSLAHSFVDSGYASGTVAKSEQVQDRDDDQPQHFTQNGDASDPENVASGDTGTVYDAPSIPASEKETYISELADDLISKVCYDQPQGTGQTNKEPDKRLMERICTILPELLRALAFSVGQNAQAQEYRDISVYVHKYRTEIVECFKEKYSREEGDHSYEGSIPDSVKDNSQGMTANEKFDLWQQLNQDLPEDGVPLDDNPSGNSITDQNPDSSPDDRALSDEADVSEATKRAQKYLHLIYDTTAYKWLLRRLRQEFLLAPAEPNVMANISQSIIKFLRSVRSGNIVSSKPSSYAYTMTFRLDWDPRAFIEEQEYEEEPDDAIGLAITLTGSTKDTQALSCAQYLCQTWPLIGEQTLQLVKKVVCSEYGKKHKCDLPDNTKLTAWMEASKFTVEASGTGHSLAEIAGELAWLGAALRSPRRSDEFGVAYCQPSIARFGDNSPHPMSDLRPEPIIWNISFEFREESDYPPHSNSQCWFNLFRNPVIVQGYPILCRPEYGTGLEIPLNVVAKLTQARRATTFDGRVFVKGFCAMLVLERHLGDVLIWHMMANKDESYISYLDPQLSGLPSYDADKIVLSGLESTRHIVGWCSNAESYTGTPEANYGVGRSKRETSDKKFCRSDAPLHRGDFIRDDRTVAVAKKDKATAFGGKYGFYLDRITRSKFQWVVIYDSDTSRGWLVDGASALLHLVRASLASDESDVDLHSRHTFNIQEYDENVENRGQNRAFNILLNPNNRKQEVLRESAWPFEDRVDDIWSTLELIDANQQRFNKMGEIHRGYLEGFEFVDIANRHSKLVRVCMKEVCPQETTWLNLTRKVDATVLFGNDFGDLIKPESTDGLCPSWVTVPSGKNYLAVRVSDLTRVLKEKGNQTKKPWRLIDNVCWYNPGKLFVKCSCPDETSEGRCELAQVLLPETVVVHDNFTSPEELLDSGAVIFGYSKKCPRYWEKDPGSDAFGSSSNRGSSTAEDSRSFAASSSRLELTKGSSGDNDSSAGSSMPLQLDQDQRSMHSRQAEKVDVDDTTHIDQRLVENSSRSQPPPIRDTPNTMKIPHQFQIFALILVPLIAIFSLNFYWKTLFISFLATWLYWIFVFPKRLSSSNPRYSPQTQNSLKKCVRESAKGIGLLLLLAWCFFLSPIHIFTPTLLDAWTTYSDHPPLQSFNTLYDPGETSVVDVFAIHGLGSNPFGAWRYTGNGTDTYWLRDILPKEKGFENMRITMLNHQTRWDSHAPQVDFDRYAKMMLDDIEHINQGNRPIIFVAHSFGGLLLKKTLVLAITKSKQIAEMTRGILFLGVPHYGTKAAFIASLLSCTAYWRGSSTTLLEYMSEGSPAVMALDNQFYDIYARPSRTLGIKIPYICNFLEMKPESFGKLSLSPTVNINSGSLRYAEDVLLDTDHRGLNKFQSPTDPNFEKFLRHFTRAYLYGNTNV